MPKKASRNGPRTRKNPSLLYCVQREGPNILLAFHDPTTGHRMTLQVRRDSIGVLGAVCNAAGVDHLDEDTDCTDWSGALHGELQAFAAVAPAAAEG